MVSLRRKLEHFEQEDRDGACLPVCAYMVLKYHSRTIRTRRLERVMGTIKGIGTPFSRIVRLERVGVRVMVGAGNLDVLRQHLEADRPCIVAVHTSELPYTDISTSHAVVVVKMTDKIVHLHDPMLDYAPVEVSVGDFDLAWLKGREKYAVIMPQ